MLKHKRRIEIILLTTKQTKLGTYVCLQIPLKLTE